MDAASYLGLGSVFTANMTGNTILLAIAVALIRAAGRWPGLAVPALGLETTLLAIVLIVWASAGTPALTRYAVIALSAGAMGAQSAAVRSSHVRGVNTTYITGTLVNAIGRLVDRARHSQARSNGSALPGRVWVGYALGALGGASAVIAWHAAAIAIPLAIVVTVAAKAAHERRQEGQSDGDSHTHR